MEDLRHIRQRAGHVLHRKGLIHKYPLHIDVVDDDSGFALYVETPREIGDDGWVPLHAGEIILGKMRVHHTEYIPGDPPSHYGSSGNYSDTIYLRIREMDENGNLGEWYRVLMREDIFTKNTNPPDVLEELGFNRFDSVTWFRGLERGKEYQVQMWFDLDGNGRLNPDGRYVREVYRHEDETEELGDCFNWREGDLYSSIHTLNTDPENCNIDIDRDGTMDFFVDGADTGLGLSEPTPTGSPFESEVEVGYRQPAVTGFTAQATYDLVNLTWDFFPDSIARANISHVEIYRTDSSREPVLGTNSPDFVAIVEGDLTGYSDNPPGDEPGTYWYWIRYISKEGVSGPLVGVDDEAHTQSAGVVEVLGAHDDVDALPADLGTAPVGDGSMDFLMS